MNALVEENRRLRARISELELQTKKQPLKKPPRPSKQQKIQQQQEEEEEEVLKLLPELSDVEEPRVQEEHAR